MQQLDALLFEWINHGCSNALFDALMPLFREKLFWAPLYLFVVLFAVEHWGWGSQRFLLGMALCIMLTDTLSSRVVKPLVARTRPCNDIEMEAHIVRRVDCGPGYSFTSSHAANHFALAAYFIVAFGGLHRAVRPAALIWAGLIAFSQVYVGVHYPFDVVGGAILGSLIGLGIAWVLKLGNVHPAMMNDE
jgi:membrane-associated phospholipid phosphatase